MSDIKVVLSFPRTGTHFIWSRYISSGAYQLVYDADVIPALHVLAQKYQGTIESLYPPPLNPNYNFQFSSITEIDKPLAPTEYLQFLSKKYGTGTGFELFEKVLSEQDCQDKTLLFINRFIYTCSYNFLLDNFEWSIENAIASLKLLHEWSLRSKHNFKWLLITRDESEWATSQARMGVSTSLIKKRLSEYKRVIDECNALSIPIFSMKAAIQCVNSNIINFENAITPYKYDMPATSTQTLKIIEDDNALKKTFHYFKRTLSYIIERDCYKRTSLVRSIGFFKYIFLLIPHIRRRYVNDYEGVVLNNAKIKKP